MYIRTIQRRNKDGSIVRYVQLAHNFWDADAGCSKAQVVYSFGREDELDVDALRRLARSIHRYLGPEAAVNPPPDPAVRVLSARPFGAAWVVHRMWRWLELGPAIERALAGREFRSPIERALFALVANRCLAPASKLGVERWVAEEVALPGVEAVPVQQLYRAMDALLECGDQIAEQVFFQVANLLNLEVDLLFFDTTSTYFEVEEEDELRKRGHSKDSRGDLPQVVIGLAVTREGIPVRCWVWPGNTADMSVVEEVRRDLRAWKLGRVVSVVDRGFVSEENLVELQRGGGHYIAGERLRSGKGEVAEALKRPGRYKQVRENLELKEIVVGEGARRVRYVLVRNPAQAERDAAKRADILAALQAELEHLGERAHGHGKAACALLSHAAYRRFLKQDGEGRPVLDQAAIRAEEKLDGKYLLRCSDDTLSAEDIALGYKQLQEVERAFRTLKQQLDLRPVYHRLEDRIRAHVLVCWLALVVVRFAERRSGLSWEQIRNCLGRMHRVRLEVGGRQVLDLTETTPDQERVLKALGLPEPKMVADSGC